MRETGDRWAALERHGYPVDRKRVRDLVVALADMRLIERKTAQPERYDRLEVEAPMPRSAVRAGPPGGREWHGAGRGDHRQAALSPDRHRAVRDVSAATGRGAKLARERRHPDRPEVARWLDGEIVDLDPEIRRIEISVRAIPSYAAGGTKPGEELQLAGLAEDEALKEDADLNRLTGALSSVRLDDVELREAELAGAAAHRTG